MPTLPGTVTAAAPGLLGFDADSIISATTAQQFKKAGFAFCARYLSLSNHQLPHDLSNAEATDILSAGLALVAVQHVLNEGWTPSAELGTEFGANAVSNALSIGLPHGMNLWCDLEGIAPETPAQAVIDYCRAWYLEVHNDGFAPGLYVGANCILNGEQLYDLPFQHYWRSLSTVPEIPTRGYQMVQHWDSTPYFGIGIDKDNTQTDNLEGTALWLASNITA